MNKTVGLLFLGVILICIPTLLGCGGGSGEAIKPETIAPLPPDEDGMVGGGGAEPDAQDAD